MIEDLTGRCACGAVSYRTKGHLDRGYACHCTDCQKRTGSAFATLLPVAASGLAVVGEPGTVTQQERGGVIASLHYCPACMTRLFTRNPSWPDLVILRAGTLDRSREFVPALHIWTRSAQSWIAIPSHAPSRETQPETPEEWRALLWPQGPR
jgi:hypothetical protein